MSIRDLFLISVATAAMTAVTLTHAEDWPQWRGSLRDGVSRETGLLKELPASGPHLAWRAAGIGAGYSSVSIAKGVVFTIGDKEDASFAIALDAGTGKQVWTAKLGKPGAPGWGGFSGPRSTPTVDNDLVFVVGQWGEMACLKADSGKEIWRKDFTVDFGASRPEWGFAESPLVDGDAVMVTPGGPDGAVVALDKKTGSILWRTKDFTDRAHYASLITAEIGGVKQYIQLTAENVAGIAAKDGKLLWKAPRKGATAVIPTPVVRDNFVYVTSGYGIGCNLFKINHQGGAFIAEEVYSNKLMQNHHGGVVRIEDYIYGYSDSKGWTCQEMATGKALWQEKSKLGKGSIVAADGRLWLRGEDGKGTVALIDASTEGYKDHGSFNPPDRSDKNSWAHPVIANGKLYLRDQDVLLCYDVKAR
jgi:outer membrane protein assembly factor BamB